MASPFSPTPKKNALSRPLPLRRFRLSPIGHVALAASLFAAATLRAEIEFVGILATTQSTRFALGDTTSGKTDWVEQGAVFSGHTVVSYNPKDETLLLRYEGTDILVRLKDDAKVKAARVELTGAVSFGAAEKIEIERATLQFDQENVFPLRDGVTYRITPSRLPDGNVKYNMAVERVLAPNKSERISSPAIVTLPGQPFSIQIGDLGFAFQPR